MPASEGTSISVSAAEQKYRPTTLGVKMQFSLIIPTYNRLEMLKAALISVWAQRFTDFEVIVVDDGSTDGTMSYLDSIGSRVRAVTQDNRGPGSARNLGMRMAQGRYIAFLDSDDVWFPWSLETYASVIRDLESPAFIAGKPYRFALDDSPRGLRAEPLKTERFRDYFASGDEWRWWGVSSFVIRTDIIRAVGGFTELNINGEDGDLALKLGVAGEFVQVASPFTFGYREHPVAATRNLRATIDGAWHKVRAEQNGLYPGGAERAVERWRILTRHLRPVSLRCLREGRLVDGCRLFFATIRWHLRLGRWTYLLAFPIYVVVSALFGSLQKGNRDR